MAQQVQGVSRMTEYTCERNREPKPWYTLERTIVPFFVPLTFIFFLLSRLLCFTFLFVETQLLLFHQLQKTCVYCCQRSYCCLLFISIGVNVIWRRQDILATSCWSWSYWICPISMQIFLLKYCLDTSLVRTAFVFNYGNEIYLFAFDDLGTRCTQKPTLLPL